MKPGILYVASHRDGLGGGEFYLFELADSLRDEFRIGFVEAGNNDMLYRTILEHEYPVLRLSYSLLSSFGIARRLAIICREWNINLVHFNNRRDLPMISLFSFFSYTRIPTVLTIHTGYFSKYLGLKENLKSAFAVVLGRIFGRSVNRYITLSESNTKKVRRLFGLSSKRFSLIPNGIRLPQRQIVQSQEGMPTVPRICVVSRLDRFKGIDFLLKALFLLCSEGFCQFECLIVGDGPERHSLKSLARSHNLQNNVQFYGRLPRHKVFDIIAESRMLVLPSFYEGFPLTLLEAMALGLPIITTRIQGLPEIIPEGKNGILVSPGNVHELAQAIQTLLSNPDMAQKMGREGQHLVETRFSVEAMVGKTRRVYEELLEA
jgi:glycosyltransferase involved in cell wall biosynthesis